MRGCFIGGLFCFLSAHSHFLAFWLRSSIVWGLPGQHRGRESTCRCRRRKRCIFHPRVGKVPWRRAWQPTPVFLPGESHGQRSLAGYSPRSRKESDMTEVTEHTDTLCGSSKCFTCTHVIVTQKAQQTQTVQHRFGGVVSWVGDACWQDFGQ